MYCDNGVSCCSVVIVCVQVVLKEKELDDPDPETLFLFTPLIEVSGGV